MLTKLDSAGEVNVSVHSSQVMTVLHISEKILNH